VAWYDNFPDSGQLPGGGWYDQFPGAGTDWLGGLPDPYGSYTPDGLAGQLPNWYDRFPGAGAGGGDPLSSFLGSSPWQANYGISGGFGGGYNPSPLLSGSNYGLAPTPSPASSTWGSLSSFPGFGQGQSFGGFSGGASRSPYQSPGMQRTSGMPGYGQQQSLGQPQGYGQQTQQPPQQGYGQQAGYSGGTSNPANVQGGGGGGILPVPSGGVYGATKWSSSMGSNAVDIFVRRGTPVTAPVSGTLQQGQNGQLILVGDNGLSFAFRHGQTTAQGHVQAGQQIGVVNDPGMDMLGRPGFGQMPDGYQHLELSVSRGNYFPGTPGGGGNIDAAQWLESQGYRGTKMQRTPGPPDAQGGGGMGGMMGGMGGGMGGMFGGMGGGMPGRGGGMGGFPGMGGMGGMFGGMGGMGGFGGMPGMNPFGGGMGGFGGGFGGGY